MNEARFSILALAALVSVLAVADEAAALVTTFAAYDPASDTLRIICTETHPDGTARTGNAAGTFVRIFNHANSLVVTDATPTEISHGGYRYDHSPATEGLFTVMCRTTHPVTGAPTAELNVVLVSARDNNTDVIALLEAQAAEEAAADSEALEQFSFWAELVVFGFLAIFSVFRMTQSGLRQLGITVFASAGLVQTLLRDVNDIVPEWPRALSLFMVWVAWGLITILAARHVRRTRNLPPGRGPTERRASRQASPPEV